MRLAFALAIVGFGLLHLPAVATAQEPDADLAELQGKGIHLYFAGDYTNAWQSLSQAIAMGATDPRCFYFNGLANHKLGLVDEAIADFRQGAEMEVAEAFPAKVINRALTRVQGADRQLLEKHRAEVKTAAALAKREERKRRYQTIKSAEARTLVQPKVKEANPFGPDPSEVSAEPLNATIDPMEDPEAEPMMEDGPSEEPMDEPNEDSPMTEDEPEAPVVPTAKSGGSPNQAKGAAAGFSVFGKMLQNTVRGMIPGNVPIPGLGGAGGPAPPRPPVDDSEFGADPFADPPAGDAPVEDMEEGPTSEEPAEEPGTTPGDAAEDDPFGSDPFGDPK